MTTSIPLEQSLVHTADHVLGWLLFLPRDAALILFAAGTALLMTLVRRLVTNQELLRKCRDDLKTLAMLRRTARQSRDKPTQERIRRTIGMIKSLQLSADFRVLSVVIIPVAVLAIWAGQRFEYLPLRVGEDLVIKAYYPVSSVDHLTHMVPSSDIELKSPAIQVVRSHVADRFRGGIAEWRLRPLVATNDLAITIRHRGESMVHHATVGKGIYLPPRQQLSTEKFVSADLELQSYNPAGLQFVSRYVGLPAWMLAYVLLTLMFVPVLKRLLCVA